MLSTDASLLLLSNLLSDLNPQVHVQQFFRAAPSLEHEVKDVVWSQLQPWKKAKPWAAVKAGGTWKGAVMLLASSPLCFLVSGLPRRETPGMG